MCDIPINDGLHFHGVLADRAAAGVSKEVRMGNGQEKPKVCPVCRHQFRGSGWDGIDAHWRAKHQSIMPYEQSRGHQYRRARRGRSGASYRRGYQQGPHAALQAVLTTTTDKLRTWVEEKPIRWRYLERVYDRHFSPPRP